MQKLSTLDLIGLILVIIGGLNWGLVGAFNYNLVDSIFGTDSILTKIIYILVGLSALWWIFAAMKMNKSAA